MLYLVGSLRNPQVPVVAENLRRAGVGVFDAWYSSGKNADQEWTNHERFMGHTFREALEGPHAQDVFDFDKRYLDLSDAGLLVMPAGKSGFMELGYLKGCRKPVGILLDHDEVACWDVMFRFARVFEELEEVIRWLRTYSLE